MASDKEQQSIDVPQHKRIAQGAPLDGTSMGGKGKGQSSTTPKQHKGALDHVEKK
jgi:hypothetical protein